MTSLDRSVILARQGHVFSAMEMSACIRALMADDADAGQASAFLTALHHRGETAEEIAGAAAALRALAHTIDAPDGAIDCCGTGGDGANTLNISTAVAFVAAACGVPVAKHGNRSATSKSGAADVLEVMGVPLALPRETLERALRDLNFCFLLAPAHHTAMKNVAAVRRALGHRTIFNLLGPLANPAGAKKQLLGVFDARWLEPMAAALNTLGTQRAIIVHGHDGLDEITLTGPTAAVFLQDGTITPRTLLPDDFGLSPIAGADIAGGGADYNAAALLALLHGAPSAYRSMVLANAAAVLHLHDGRGLMDGTVAAAAAIDSGAALSILTRYKELS